MSRVRRDHPRCRSATWICMSGHTRDLVTVQGFWSNRGSKFGLSHYFGYWLLQQLVLSYNQGLGCIDRHNIKCGLLLPKFHSLRVCVFVGQKWERQEYTRQWQWKWLLFHVCQNSHRSTHTGELRCTIWPVWSLAVSVTHELLDRTHWPGMFWIYLKKTNNTVKSLLPSRDFDAKTVECLILNTFIIQW